MSEITQPLYGTAARDVGKSLRKSADSATIAHARRLLAEADAVDMSDPREMARALSANGARGTYEFSHVVPAIALYVYPLAVCGFAGSSPHA